MNGYSLTRKWFDFASDNYKCKAIHTALYLWIVEKNNRLLWKKEFGLPSADTMDVLSIGNKRTYLSALNDLIEWGFVVMIQPSKNQHQACVISLCHSNNDTADKSVVAILPQHCPSTALGTAPIVKPLNLLKDKTKKEVDTERLKEEERKKEEEGRKEEEKISFDIFWKLYEHPSNPEGIDKLWNKLSLSDQKDILEFVPRYKFGKPEVTFRKSPANFFREKTWRFPIMPSGKPPKVQVTTGPKSKF